MENALCGALATKRLTLRRARPDDLDQLHALVSDFDVVGTTGTWPWPPDRAFTATRCAPGDAATGLSGPMFLGDRMIGSMACHDGDLGYLIARPFWGQGYASEMARALVAHVFATYDWCELRAYVYDANPASARVLQKLGFTVTEHCDLPNAARGASLPGQRFILPRPVTP